jgi:hypothetical protein
MRTVTVRQLDRKSSKTVMFHEFPMPEVRDYGFYRTTISYSAFFDSGKGRNMSDRNLFIAQRGDDGDFIRNYLNEDDSNVPVTEYSDLYHFFHEINYCQKTKKIHEPLEDEQHEASTLRLS